MTAFFKSTKSLNGAPYAKNIAEASQPTYKIEAITQQLRGDQVKILWLPKAHYELNASEYVSVFLQNQIVLRANENDEDVIDSCQRAMDNFPNQVWETAFELVENCEIFYESDDFGWNADDHHLCHLNASTSFATKDKESSLDGDIN